MLLALSSDPTVCEYYYQFFSKLSLRVQQFVSCLMLARNPLAHPSMNSGNVGFTVLPQNSSLNPVLPRLWQAQECWRRLRRVSIFILRSPIRSHVTCQNLCWFRTGLFSRSGVSTSSLAKLRGEYSLIYIGPNFSCMCSHYVRSTKCQTSWTNPLRFAADSI